MFVPSRCNLQSFGCVDDTIKKLRQFYSLIPFQFVFFTRYQYFYRTNYMMNKIVNSTYNASFYRIRIPHFFYLMILSVAQLSCQEEILISQDDKDPLIEYLGDDLWTDDYAYDAAHFLMVPLHYSYEIKDKELMVKFEDFFRRFDEDKSQFKSIDSELKRLQFNYLISQFVALECQLEEKNADLVKSLTTHLEEEFKQFYLNETVINWKYPDNDNYQFVGNRERIKWKLSDALDATYFKKSIIDPELFLMGIAADLLFTYSNCKELSPPDTLLGNLYEINTLALVVFNSRFTRTESGWIFQKGYWNKHRDFKYAGCLTQECVEKGPSPIADISPDTSHTLRLPLILSSLERANPRDKEFYREAKRGLADQVNNKVIEITDSGKNIRITNYLDGRNGYYRWDFVTNKGTGYGPYEVGETFKLGWWTFLEDQKIKKVYAQMSSNLKNNVAEEKQFQDKTNRERHPVIAERFDNGLFQGITAMASAL